MSVRRSARWPTFIPTFSFRRFRLVIYVNVTLITFAYSPDNRAASTFVHIMARVHAGRGEDGAGNAIVHRPRVQDSSLQRPGREPS